MKATITIEYDEFKSMKDEINDLKYELNNIEKAIGKVYKINKESLFQNLNNIEEAETKSMLLNYQFTGKY
jgi:hypothetical protein